MGEIDRGTLVGSILLTFIATAMLIMVAVTAWNEAVSAGCEKALRAIGETSAYTKCN